MSAALHHARQSGDWSGVISAYIGAARGESEAFYLTHAYIHALEAGDARAPGLRKRLVTLRAEVEDPT